MVRSCTAYNCTERFTKGGTLSFHSFPSDPEQRKLWIIATKRRNFNPTKYSHLCSKHFDKKCFDTSRFGSWRSLKTDAVPTLFDFHIDLEKSGLKRGAPRRICSDVAAMHTSSFYDKKYFSESSTSQVSDTESTRLKSSSGFSNTKTVGTDTVVRVMPKLNKSLGITSISKRSPSNPKCKSSWLEISKEYNEDIKPTDLVCSTHFESNSFHITGKNELKTQIPEAVPSIFQDTPIKFEFIEVEECKVPVTEDTRKDVDAGSAWSLQPSTLKTYITSQQKTPNIHKQNYKRDSSENIQARSSFSLQSFYQDNKEIVKRELKECEDNVTLKEATTEIALSLQQSTSEAHVSQQDISNTNGQSFQRDYSEDIQAMVSPSQQPCLQEGKSKTVKRKVDGSDNVTSVKKVRLWCPARIGDLNESHFDTPSKIKTHLQLIQTKFTAKQSQVKQLQQHVKKLEKKVGKLETLVQQSQVKQLQQHVKKLDKKVEKWKHLCNYYKQKALY